MGVTERGLDAWKHRPPSHRQRRDMVLLAHIRDQHRLSLSRYGHLSHGSTPIAPSEPMDRKACDRSDGPVT
jgi:hypothetical protein